MGSGISAILLYLSFAVETKAPVLKLMFRPSVGPIPP
jgi:hypothetical protein